MELVFVTLAVVVTAHCFTSEQLYSRRLEDKNKRVGIYDGRKTKIEKHPYLVSVLQDDAFECAATIVSSSWVMTSAIYGAQLDPKLCQVVAGSQNGLKGKFYKVKKIVLHPKYDPQVIDFEYALIQVKGKFKWSRKTKPIKLPAAEAKPNTRMIVAGWGKTSAGGQDDGPVLMQGTMKWLDNDTCSYTYAGLPWTDRLACAYNKGKVTLCDYDYGDPFVRKGMFYGFFFAGMTEGFCTADAPPVLLSNIYPVTSWIRNTTGAA